MGVAEGQRAGLRPGAALAPYGDDDDDTFIEDEQYWTQGPAKPGT